MKTKKSVVIAKYFLCKSDWLNWKDVNVLCYYSYAWYLNIHKKKLFESEIYLDWNGCIVTDIINEFKDFGYSKIPQLKIDKIKFLEYLTEEEMNFLDLIYSKYRNSSNSQIVNVNEQFFLEIRKKNGLLSFEHSHLVLEDRYIENFYIDTYIDLNTYDPMAHAEHIFSKLDIKSKKEEVPDIDIYNI